MSTHNIPLSISKKKITPNYPKYNIVCSYGIFVRDSRTSSKEFKTAVVFEPSMFEAQKVYCNSQHCATMLRQRNLVIQKNKQIK